jgi:hypothetical protein
MPEQDSLLDSQRRVSWVKFSRRKNVKRRIICRFFANKLGQIQDQFRNELDLMANALSFALIS